MNAQPSSELISAVKTYLIAKAHEETMRSIVTPYQKKILEDHQWHIDPKWVQAGDEDEVILNPDHAYLMTEDDAQAFFFLCHIQDAIHFPAFKNEKPHACPLLVAEMDRVNAEALIIQNSKALTGYDLNPSDLVLDERKKFIDLTVGYVLSVTPEITSAGLMQEVIAA